MAYQQNNEFYATDWNQGWDGYDMSSVDQGNQDMLSEPQFGTFDYSGQAPSYEGVPYDAPPASAPVHYDPSAVASAAPVDLGNDFSAAFMPPPTSTPYTGQIFQPQSNMQPTMQRQPSSGPHSSFDNPMSHHHPGGGDDFEDEPPLLEELGINFDHIVQKTWSVLHLFKETEPTVVGDSDMAGPLVFCLLFMGSLLLGGKVAFGYIYGLGLCGCVGMFLLLNLMSVSGVAITCVVSILGYCLLPMVILSFVAAVFSLKGLSGMLLTGVAIVWCGLAAAKLFVSALAMDHQQLIVMYPCCLVYGVFALLTVF